MNLEVGYNPENNYYAIQAFDQVHLKADEIDLRALEEFKKKFLEIDTFRKNADEIDDELLRIIPKHIELEEIINGIFECSGRSHTLPCLDAISRIHLLFVLSSYSRIQKSILEDKRHLLTNESLIAMFMDYGLHPDEEKMTVCYKLAYQISHPYIYPPALVPVRSEDYTLNFLWVNLNPQDRIQNLAKNIFKNGLDLSENAKCIIDPNEIRRLEREEALLDPEALAGWKEIKESFTYKISKWADMHQGAKIILWYDDGLVTSNAIQETFDMMKAISLTRRVDLRLRSVRRLPNLKGEIAHSLHPGTQIYYRVDILKALIADHMFTAPEENSKYCVFSDIDIEPMSPGHLFDQRTLDYLSLKGYVFNKSGHYDFENSFFIFNKEHESIQNVHYQTIIKTTEKNIKWLRKHPKDTCFHAERILDSQFVFSKYDDFRMEMGEISEYRA